MVFCNCLMTAPLESQDAWHMALPPAAVERLAAFLNPFAFAECRKLAIAHSLSARAPHHLLGTRCVRSSAARYVHMIPHPVLALHAAIRHEARQQLADSHNARSDACQQATERQRIRHGIRSVRRIGSCPPIADSLEAACALRKVGEASMSGNSAATRASDPSAAICCAVSEGPLSTAFQMCSLPSCMDNDPGFGEEIPAPSAYCRDLTAPSVIAVADVHVARALPQLLDRAPDMASAPEVALGQSTAIFDMDLFGRFHKVRNTLDCKTQEKRLLVDWSEQCRGLQANLEDMIMKLRAPQIPWEEDLRDRLDRARIAKEEHAPQQPSERILAARSALLRYQYVISTRSQAPSEVPMPFSEFPVANGSAGIRHVQFDLAAITVHDVPCYAEIFGLHPREFNFDASGLMVRILRK